MPAYLEDVGHGDQLGLKWVAVYNTNAERGLPIINGVVVICDTDTGLPRALMGAAFLTGIRTAAVSGACMEALAPADVGHVAITGAGVQTRSHLEVCQELGHLDVTVFARRAAAGDAVVAWAAEHAPRLRVTIVGSTAEAVRGAGVIITGVPIGVEGRPARSRPRCATTRCCCRSTGARRWAPTSPTRRACSPTTCRSSRASPSAARSRATGPPTATPARRCSCRARPAAWSARTSARAPPTCCSATPSRVNAERDGVGTLLER